LVKYAKFESGTGHAIRSEWQSTIHVITTQGKNIECDYTTVMKYAKRLGSMVQQ